MGKRIFLEKTLSYILQNPISTRQRYGLKKHEQINTNIGHLVQALHAISTRRKFSPYKNDKWYGLFQLLVREFLVSVRLTLWPQIFNS